MDQSREQLLLYRMNIAKRISKWLGISTAAVGILVLVGWALDIPLLKSLFPGLATMKFNTALLFLLSGISLVTGSSRQRIAQFSAAVVIILAALTLAEYLLGLDLGIDEWVVRDIATARANGAFPGRMSVMTAINFVLVGGSLLMMIQRVRIFQWPALLAGILALVAAISYLYELELLLYYFHLYSTMAVHTALSFLTLSIGIFFANTHSELMRIAASDSAGGILIRRLLPITCLILVILGWFQFRGYSQGLYNLEFGSVLVVVLNITTLAIAIRRAAGYLHRVDMQRLEAEASLREANTELEQRVAERTRQLDMLNAELHSEIEARSQVDAWLHQSRDELQTIIRNFPGAIGSFDQDLRLQYVDGAVLSVLGLQSATIGSKTIAELLPPAAAEIVLSALRATLEGEKKVLEIAFADREILLDAHPLHDSNGEISRGIFTALDITELKHAQMATAASEEKFRALFEFAPDPIVIADETGQITLLNRKAEALTGYHRQELIGQPVEVLLPQHLHRAHIVQRAEYMAAPMPRSMGEGLDLAMRHKSGTEIPVEISLNAVKTNDEIHVIAFIIDITARRRTQQQLEDQRNFLRHIIDLDGSFIFVKDEAGRFVLANKALAESAGITPEEMVGKTDADINPNTEEIEYLRKIDLEVIRTRQPRFIPEEAITNPITGEKRWYQTTKVPLISEDGLTIQVVGNSTDITAIKRTEQALQASEGQFRAIFEQAAVGISLMTPDGHWLKVNQKLCDIVGYMQDELLDMTFREITHPDDLDDDLALFDQTLAGKISSYSMEKRYLRKNGGIIWINLTVSLVRASSGVPQYWVAVIEDIDERKQAENALRQSEERFRQLFDSSPVGKTLTAPDNKLLKNNLAFASMLGYTVEEVQQLKFPQVVHPDDLLESREVFRRLLADEQAGDRSERRYVHKNGEIVWVDVNTRLLRDENDVPLYILTNYIDITEHKRSATILQESETQFRATFEQAAVGIAQVGLDGRWLKINQKLCDIVGYSAQELHQLTFQDITHPDDLEIDLDYVRQMLADEIQTYSMEKRYIRKDRSSVWINLTVSLVRDSAGRTKYFISIIEDIDDRKLLQRALSESEEEYRTLFKTMAQGVIYYNGQGEIVSANPAAEHILGMTLDQMQGRTTVDLHRRIIHEDGSDIADEAHPAMIALRTGEKVHNEVIGILNPLDDSYRWITVNATPQFRPGSSAPYQVYTTFTDITELRQSQETLAAERNLLRTLFDHLPEHIYVKDTEGCFLLANQAILRHFDLEALDNILGKTDFDLLSPEEAARQRQEEIEIIQTGQLLEDAEQVALRGGFERWLSVTKVPLRDDSGEITGIVGINHDITERKRAEQALRENEARYRLLANNLPSMGVIMFDHEMDCVMDGPLIENHLEHLTEIIDIAMLKPLSDSEGISDTSQFQYHAILGGEELAFEHRANGSFYEVIAGPIRQTDGSISAGMLAIRDITDQKRAENELRLLLILSDQIAGAPDFDTALQTVLMVMCTNTDLVLGEAWIPDADGEVMKMGATYTPYPENRELQRYVESSQDYKFVPGEGLVGSIWLSQTIDWKNNLQLLSEEAFTRVGLVKAANLQAALGLPIIAEGRVLAVLVFYVPNSYLQEDRMVELASAVASQLGTVLRQKLLQDELERSGQALAQSNQELQQFAYVASHDLQEPLRVITSYLQLLERRYKGQLGEDADKYITRSVAASGRMKALIEDLLQYSRVNSRGDSFAPVDMAQILENALANLETAIDESQVRIYHDPMPTVIADSRQIAQVLQNLIANAIKFRGEQAPEIHIGVQKQANEWVFSVRDNGIGIEPQYFQRIFIIFQRLHSRSHYEGTGIGLAICRKIIERHGGSMWIESELGEGSTFYFTLPDK